MKPLLVVTAALTILTALVVGLTLRTKATLAPAQRTEAIAAPAPQALTQAELDKAFIEKHRSEFDCAQQICIDNLKLQMTLVENRYGYDFAHQYDLCLANAPQKPTNIARCVRVFQRVDKMRKEMDDAEAKRKANW